MTKHVLPAIIVASVFLFSGCSLAGTVMRQVSPSVEESSVELPTGYTVQHNGAMTMITSDHGKLIVGGFVPSVGHPVPDDGDIRFQKITYTADPKMDAAAQPVALYYRNGDTVTEKELEDILAALKNTTFDASYNSATKRGDE